MAAVLLCNQEQEAMIGMPHLQCLLYIFGLRPHMDFSTGIVGLARGVSWQSLREALYVEPAAGIKGGSPSKDQLRGAAKGLERAGLIKSKSTREKLIFECLLAQTDKNAQNKVTTKSPSKVTTCKPNVEAIISNIVTITKNDKVTTPPRVRDLKSTSSENAASQNDDDDKNLIFSEKLRPVEIDAIGKLLKGFKQPLAQSMLDELAGHMSAKQINSPVGYFRTIVKDVKNGNWQPERAFRVEQGRARQLAIKIQAEESAKAAIIKKQNPNAGKKPQKERESLLSVLKKTNKPEVTI